MHGCESPCALPDVDLDVNIARAAFLPRHQSPRQCGTIKRLKGETTGPDKVGPVPIAYGRNIPLQGKICLANGAKTSNRLRVFRQECASVHHEGRDRI